jgi:hypothetical protein
VRAKQAGTPGGRAKQPPAAPAGPDDADQVEALSLRAKESRAAEKRALRKVEAFLTSGLANEARAASSVARDHAARATQLEQQAHAEAEHRARMAEAEARLEAGQAAIFGHAVKLFVGALGLDWNEASDDLLSACLKAITEGKRTEGGTWAVDLPTEAGAAARESIEAAWRSELADEHRLSQEAVEPGADPDPAEPQGSPDLAADAGARASDSLVADSAIERLPAPDDLGDFPEPNLPAWDDLPADWQRRFSLHRHLGCVEYQRHLRREQRQAELGTVTGPRRSSRWPSFRHPGLQAGDRLR